MKYNLIFEETLMKIVICDDSLQDLSDIEKLLLAYQDCHQGIYLDIEKFSDASQLSRKIQENKLADIYILDMIMAPRTGIDIGRQLRNLGNESAIIYITVSDDFALEAYDVHAVRYLLKPVIQEKAFEAFHYAIAYTKTKTDATYMLKTREGLFSIPYSKIEYIENSSRTLRVHMTDGKILNSIFIRGSFDEEIAGLANDQQFFQVHKSFMVNLKHVQQLSRNHIVMESGAFIPISQKRTSETRNRYLSFISEYYS